jgi:hypothetical protein
LLFGPPVHVVFTSVAATVPGAAWAVTGGRKAALLATSAVTSMARDADLTFITL